MIARPVHVSPRELELYVIDGLVANDASRIEEHVVACDACAAALAREAQLELAMDLIAQTPPRALLVGPRVTHYDSRCVAVRRRRSVESRKVWFAGLSGALAMAAATILWIAPAASEERHSFGEPSAGIVQPAPASHAGDALDGG